MTNLLMTNNSNWSIETPAVPKLSAFSNSPSGARSNHTTGQVIALAMLAITTPLNSFAAGSGGVLNQSNIRIGGSAIARVPTIDYIESGSAEISIISVEEKISLFKKMFSLSVVDLASILDVSRPAVYQWLNGAVPKDDTLYRINTFYSLAKRMKSNGIFISKMDLKSSCSKGLSLFDLLSSKNLSESEIWRSINSFKSMGGKPRSIASVLKAKGFPELRDDDHKKGIDIATW